MMTAHSYMGMPPAIHAANPMVSPSRPAVRPAGDIYDDFLRDLGFSGSDSASSSSSGVRLTPEQAERLYRAQTERQTQSQIIQGVAQGVQEFMRLLSTAISSGNQLEMERVRVAGLQRIAEIQARARSEANAEAAASYRQQLETMQRLMSQLQQAQAAAQAGNTAQLQTIAAQVQQEAAMSGQGASRPNWGLIAGVGAAGVALVAILFMMSRR